ncbi:DedA family protein [Bacillus sp. V3-13]|uniref:DedA family protein n=1 Tax=Bacillus sp. V3-13 TaxID=2053728 RepID=UPI000C77BE21|nr:DedA family protein [Bacillus sp. V3-13]PLR79361.1 DedA family protein [Bacillus sp. V3-13]
MDLEFILNIIEEGGYSGLFLWLWLGIFGMPVPNEVIVMTVGLATSQGVLNPILTFFVVYIGILTALTTIYALGHFLGRPLLRMFAKKKKFSKSIEKSLYLIEKYHAFSLSFSYFLPGVRNFVPFLYGSSRLPYKSFALFAYSGAFVWLLIMFTLGYMFGEEIDTIMQYGKELLLILGVCAAIYVSFKMYRKKRREKMQAS